MLMVERNAVVFQGFDGRKNKGASYIKGFVNQLKGITST